MRVITAPKEDLYVKTETSKKIFLAGTITGTSDWQADLIEKIYKNTFNINLKNVTFYNPRRPNFDVTDPNVEEEQIVWEYRHLKQADAIVFWFAKETVAPITHYEYGKWAMSTDKKIFVAADPEYPRRRDVSIQTELARKEVLQPFGVLSNSLDELASDVKYYLESGYK